MRVSRINTANKSFKGIYNNKLLLNSLEKISEHPGTFVSGTMFAMSSIVRPLAIAASPGVDKDNKRYAVTNSFASAAAKFAVSEAIILPVELGMNKIAKEPEKYLNESTIKKLQNGADSLIKSKKFNSVSQIIKLSPQLLGAIPKTMITAALIPVFMNLLFKKNRGKEKIQTEKSATPDIFKEFTQKRNNPSFKGNISDIIPKGIGEILNAGILTDNLSPLKGKNITRNISIATDVLLTTSYVKRINKSTKIDEKRKKPLIYNNIISTTASLALGCAADEAIKKSTKNSIKKFTEANINNPKLEKYINGINTARPALVFAGVYYGVFPFISTFLADRTDKYINKKRSD